MKKNIFASVTALVILICLLCGCNTSIKTPNLMDEVSANPVERRPLSQPDSASATDFAVRLFKASNEDGKNTLISPLSVLVALSMTANGAAENTLIQMENVLGMPIDELNSFIKAYSASLPRGEKYKLNLANSIWLDNGFPANDEFLQTNTDYCGAGIYERPFNDNKTVDEINDWVKEKTEEMIPEILDEIPADAVMYLINALVFEAEWEEMYGEYSVRETEFTKENGEKQTVQMMYSIESKYISDENAEGFIKYYKDGKYAFAVLKPKEGMNVAEYVETLNGEKLNQTLSEAQSISVNAGLPKFETEFDVEMSDILIGMGMTDAFDKNVADFTGISTLKGKDLFIGRVLHKTFISVCEKGTKAGAATVVEVLDECAPMYEKTVILDSPFVYMLIDCENNIPFFIGTLNKVQSAEKTDTTSENEQEQTGISKYITEENGKYILTLPESEKTLKLNDTEDDFVNHISDALVEAAEKKITEDASKYSDSPHFYLTVKDDGELYLAAEVIYYLDEPDENEGCYDHKHLFFSERISNRTDK